MAGGASANPSNLRGTPVSTTGPTSSAYTPQFATLPSAPAASAPGATYSLSTTPRQGFAQQGAPYQPFASRMPTSVSGYGNFPQAPTSVNRGPNADQVRAQMMAYQQRYQPGMQQARQDVQQFNTNVRAAEEARKAEIARQAAEAEAERQRQAAEAERIRQEQEAAASSYSDSGWYGGGASGGLATLQGFER